jgi:hypothetical protein
MDTPIIVALIGVAGSVVVPVLNQHLAGRVKVQEKELAWIKSLIGLINPSCHLLKSMGFCLTLTVKSPISPQEEPAHGRQNYRNVLSV